MKKYLIIIMLGVSLLTFNGDTAYADTNVTILPQTVTTQAGDSFNVTVAINPENEQIFSGGVRINFPANLLRITGFRFNENVIPVTASTYDLIDNVNGIMVKTAGFPGGISESTVLGTITFSALQSGTAQLSVINGTIMLDEDGNNDFTLSGIGSNVTISPRVTLNTTDTSASNNASRPSQIVSTEPENDTIVPGDFSGVGGPDDNATIAQNDDGSLIAQVGTTTDDIENPNRLRNIGIGVLILIIVIAIIYGISRGA